MNNISNTPVAQEKENELEKTLLSIQETIDKVIAAQVKLQSQADDKGQFGEYRYCSGRIDGLKCAREIVSDSLANLWGM